MEKEIGNARITPTIKKSAYKENPKSIERYELISVMTATKRVWMLNKNRYFFIIGILILLLQKLNEFTK